MVHLSRRLRQRVQAGNLWDRYGRTLFILLCARLVFAGSYQSRYPVESTGLNCWFEVVNIHTADPFRLGGERLARTRFSNIASA